MYRRAMIFGLAAAGLSACAGRPNLPLGPDGLPLPTAYIIAPGEEAAVKFRMLDSVNSLRQAANLAPVALDPQLNAAAATHARDMSIQNRPWLFGADGSSPVLRAQRAGFRGRFLGENISESYESELATLTAWMGDERTRSVIMDPNARLMGFSWFQESAGKLWWTLNMGTAPGFAGGLS
ncbi:MULTISPECIES: CAP domain-containing protein [unclassified Yoonia]|uniref:CAP domain-containing protein n=1 Tax=unclassified Yoonia TaxID=2629118 RepID=UPI002AFEBF41|nr:MULTISPECIES: CAP domain-containing protein [unclassified Yoonia]